MIKIRAMVTGEPDAPPQTIVINCAREYDERVFVNSVRGAQTKLARRLKLNVHESLLLYFACIIDSLREHVPIDVIQEQARGILSSELVLIGVPETIRLVRVAVTVDDLPKATILLRNPIQN